MAIDPYQSDIPSPARRDMPDEFQSPPAMLDQEGRGVATTWVLLTVLAALFIGALYFFAPTQTTTTPAQADAGVAQQKDPSPN